MQNTRLRQKIIGELKSDDVCRRIDAITSLPSLGREMGISIAEEIMKLGDNMGMKLEALRVLPALTDDTLLTPLSRILDLAITDADSEVVRNAMITVQNLPQRYISRSVIETIFGKLSDVDTDIVFHAINCLVYLREVIDTAEARVRIQPFSQHSNKTLRELAKKALTLID